MDRSRGWKEWEMKIGIDQMPRKWREKEGKGKPRMQWEDCVKRDLERVGGEWRTTAEDRSWRLLIENVVREK